MWNVDGTPLTSLPPDARGPLDAAISSAGRLVVAYADGTATIWNVEGVTEARRVTDLVGHGASVNNVVFGDDGKFILTTSDDGTARLWEAKSGRWLATLRDPSGKSFKAAMLSVRYASDEKLGVVTASEDGTLRRYPCDACLSIDDLIDRGNWKDVLDGDALP